MNQGFYQWGKEAVGGRDVLVLTPATFRMSGRNFKIANSLPMVQGVHELAVKLPCF